MTCLSVVQEIADLVGVPRPPVAVASTDQNVRTILAAVNLTGKNLMRRHAWEALASETTFTTTATAEQTSSPVASDFDRIIPGSMFNRTTNERVSGPLTKTQWQFRKAMTTSGIWNWFMFRGGTIYMDPVPTAGETIAYEYVSNVWTDQSGGTKFTGDSDVGLLDEDLLILGGIWRFNKSKGLPYAEDFNEYERQVMQAWAADGGYDIIDFQTPNMTSPRFPNVKEGNFNL